ncbi:MAG: DNRLRE domain-containing protein [Ignavibacteriae bacterium]|nr:DNRLRE domain-containing protein [Ignavibacteriota bacterium]
MATLFLACSEAIIDPKTPGSGLTQRDVVIRDTVLVAVSDTTFLKRLSTDPVYDESGSYVVLGQNLMGKTGNYAARALIRFTLPVRETVNVVSAKLSLKLLSWRGDSASSFEANIYKVKAGWTSYGILWDSTNSPAFFDATPLRTLTLATVGPDTQTITFDLDTALVRIWLRSETTYGLGFVPSSVGNLIRGFASFDHDSSAYRPSLQIVAEGTSSTHPRDTSSYTNGMDGYVANVSPFTILSDHIYSQAGIVYRSSLKFDVSALPRGAVINTAELQLVSDPAITKISKFTTSPLPSVHARTAGDTVYLATGSTGSISSGSTYSFDIRTQMQLWVGGTNYGLLVRQPSANELGTLDLFSFYGMRAVNESLRPRIKVKYAVFQ